MVSSSNYNINSSISTPTDLVKIVILSRWNDLLEAWELYYKQTTQGFKTDLAIVRARTISLYLALSGELSRKAKSQDQYFYKILIGRNASEQELLKVMLEINKILDIDRLIRIDTRPAYDFADIEKDNEIAGL